VTGVDTNKVKELPILVSSLADGDIKLLGVPKLAERSDHWPDQKGLTKSPEKKSLVHSMG